MTAPRIEVDLEKIRHNTQCLVRRLKPRGISVTGVTKAVGGDPAVANSMLEGGAVGLAEARISNVKRMRGAGITCPISMIRSPLLSQLDEIVLNCETSYNTEINVIDGLAVAATRANVIHNIVLMVEMGDMREGILPENLAAIALQALEMPGVALTGIGASFACLSGLAPEAATMAELSTLANEIEGSCGPVLRTISGGNSASLPWALESGPIGRINDLRLGEAILLGVDPVSGDQIGGLYTDAFTLIAEVIETKAKPEPRHLADPGLAVLRLVSDSNSTARSILAIGHQDTDISGVTMPMGIELVGATSDHTVITTARSHLNIGSEIKLDMNYAALMRAMTAPDIAKVVHGKKAIGGIAKDRRTQPSLTLV